MASIVSGHESGAQAQVDRENWFSAETQTLLECAADNPAIGPEKVLANILHNGLGLSLDLTAKLMNATKNQVAKQVETGIKQLGREARILKRNAVMTGIGGKSLF